MNEHNMPTTSQPDLALRGLLARLELARQRLHNQLKTMEYFAILGQELDRIRQVRGMSFARLCEESDLSFARVLYCLHGASHATLNDLITIGLVLGVRLNLEFHEPA